MSPLFRGSPDQQELIEELKSEKLQLEDKLDLLVSELSEVRALLKITKVGSLNNEEVDSREE